MVVNLIKIRLCKTAPIRFAKQDHYQKDVVVVKNIFRSMICNRECLKEYHTFKKNERKSLNAGLEYNTF